MKQMEILEMIIAKGGILGKCAEGIKDDEVQVHQFIHECNDQTHNQSAIDFFGVDLIHEIRNYCKLTNDK
jgi:hypothetical protein